MSFALKSFFLLWHFELKIVLLIWENTQEFPTKIVFLLAALSISLFSRLSARPLRCLFGFADGKNMRFPKK
jgi:hypothetical protein